MTSFSQHLCHPLFFHSISIFAGAEDLNVNNIHSFKRSEPRWWYRVSRSFQQIVVSNKILMITIDQHNGDEAADGLWQVVWRDPAGLTDRCHARSRTHAHLVTVHNDHPDAHKDHTTEQCNVQFAFEFLFLKTNCNFTKGLATTISLTTRVLLVLFWNVFVLVELEFCAILAMFPISNSCQMIKHEKSLLSESI